MEQKIKEIVSTFIRVPAEQIGASTPIDRSAVQSSILLHRMYARLAEEGLTVENYVAIKVFGDLFGASSAAVPTGTGNPVAAVGPAAGWSGVNLPAGIGIDIEEIAALPRTADFRKEAFYKMNFTAEEIAYCILQPDPYASFAGLFAAKEAIVKADGSVRSKTFDTLEISHTAEGKPTHPVYGISISHSGGMAVAVASTTGAGPVSLPVLSAPSPEAAGARKGGAGGWIAWLALLLSLAALAIVVLR